MHPCGLKATVLFPTCSVHYLLYNLKEHGEFSYTHGCMIYYLPTHLSNNSYFLFYVHKYRNLILIYCGVIESNYVSEKKTKEEKLKNIRILIT